MNLAFDHYSLALGVLNGEPDAHRILADLLEEQGERGLAEWSRFSRPHSRSDLVLHLLPYREIAAIGCDATDEAILHWRKADHFRVQCIAPVRRWANGGDDVQLETALATLVSRAFPAAIDVSDYRDGTINVLGSLQAFHHVVRGAQLAYAAERNGDDRIARARTQDAVTALRRYFKKIGIDSLWRGARTRAAFQSLLERT